MVIKKNQSARVCVVNGRAGLDVYLDISEGRHYLYSRKSCGLLYKWLKDGKTIRELSRIKPRSDSRSQKQLHYSKHILQIVNEYITHKIAV